MERSRNYALTNFVAADAPLQRDSDTLGSVKTLDRPIGLNDGVVIISAHR